MSKQDVTQFFATYKDLCRGSKCLVLSEIKNFEISFSPTRVVFLNNFYCHFLTTLIASRSKPYIFQAKGFCYLVFFINKYSTLVFSLQFKPKRIVFALLLTKSSIKHISTFITFLFWISRPTVSHSY